MRETPQAARAWYDYLAMGEERSIDKLAERYQTVVENPPTKRKPTIAAWSVAFDWQARLVRLEQQKQDAILADGIASKQYRIDQYNDRHRRMRQVISERAAEMDGEIAGGGTGLLVRTYKSIGKGEDAELKCEYAVDTALLKEMRETEKQTAIEMGQWVEKVAPTTPDGENEWAGKSDAELIDGLRAEFQRIVAGGGATK